MRGFRVGIVNPFTPFSKRVRELLQDRAFPIIELKLFDARARGGPTLTEFHEEILITQPLDPDLFPHLDLVFLGGDEREQLLELASAAARQGVLTIVSGAPDVDGPVVVPGLNEGSISEDNRLVVSARAPSVLLGTVLTALTRTLGVRQACATVLLPAFDKGEEAVEELHQQVVKILNFQAPPKKIFADQLAFNLIFDAEATRGLGEVIAKESAQLAGIDTGVSAVAVRVPVFHGYAASLWARMAESVEPEAVRKALRSSKRIRLYDAAHREASVPSPVSVSGSDKIHVGWIRRDPSIPDGYWLWVVADSSALDPGLHALRLAEKLLDLS